MHPSIAQSLQCAPQSTENRSRNGCGGRRCRRIGLLTMNIVAPITPMNATPRTDQIAPTRPGSCRLYGRF